MNYEDILTNKFSHLEWTITDPNDYSSITWGEVVVDKNHLDLLISDYNESALSLVKDARKDSYPSIGDQLDMLWHMMDDETIPGKDSEWYDAIKQVKDDNPKV